MASVCIQWMYDSYHPNGTAYAPSKKRYTQLDFRLDLEKQLRDGFSSPTPRLGCRPLALSMSRISVANDEDPEEWELHWDVGDVCPFKCSGQPCSVCISFTGFWHCSQGHAQTDCTTECLHEEQLRDGFPCIVVPRNACMRSSYVTASLALYQGMLAWGAVTWRLPLHCCTKECLHEEQLRDGFPCIVVPRNACMRSSYVTASLALYQGMLAWGAVTWRLPLHCTKECLHEEQLRDGFPCIVPRNACMRSSYVTASLALYQGMLAWGAVTWRLPLHCTKESLHKEQLRDGFPCIVVPKRTNGVVNGNEQNIGEHICVRTKGRKRPCVHCASTGQRTPSGGKRETVYMCKVCHSAISAAKETTMKLPSEHTSYFMIIWL